MIVGPGEYLPDSTVGPRRIPPVGPGATARCRRRCTGYGRRRRCKGGWRWTSNATSKRKDGRKPWPSFIKPENEAHFRCYSVKVWESLEWLCLGLWWLCAEVHSISQAIERLQQQALRR